MVRVDFIPSAFSIPYHFKTVVEELADRNIHPAKINNYSFNNHYEYHCIIPGHGQDVHPSLSVTQDGMEFFCFPCNIGGGPAKIVELLGSARAYRPPEAPKKFKKPKPGLDEPLQGCTLGQLAEAKGLPIEHLRSLGWYDCEYRYWLNGQWAVCKAVAMPYPSAIQYRVGLTDKKNRFRWGAKNPENAKELYGLEWLRDTDRVILAVEGTTDVAAGRWLGIPTVGVPGTGLWTKANGKRWAKELAGWRFVVWQEPGDAGQKLVNAMAQDIPDLRVIQAPPGIKDVVEVLNQAGDGAGEFLRELISEAQPYYEDLEVHDVPNRESKTNQAPKSRERSALWVAAKDIFALPSGTKPWTVARVLYNDEEGKAVVADYYSNSWRNRVNAQHKRRCLYFNILPRINGPQLYAMRVTADDWSPQEHDTIKKRIGRAIKKAGCDDRGWLWFNNALLRGHYLYLTNASDVTGFEPVEDVEATLIDTLKAIHPPAAEEAGRFRPYGGSDNWTSRVEGTGEQDQDKWEIVAVSNAPADFVQVEAECVAAGIKYEMTSPYWRVQAGSGLEMQIPAQEAIQLFSGLGYSLTRQGLAVLLNGDTIVGTDHPTMPDSWEWVAPPKNEVYRQVVL
jgi:hypothetical protein